MAIDWFTYFAQLVNFALLVFLLHRFLYRPVLRAVDRRESEIAQRLRAADEGQRRAEEERATFEALRDELAEERSAGLKAAEQEARSLQTRLESEVRAEVERRREDWHRALRIEQEGFLEGLRKTMAEQMYAALRRILRDLADADLESRIVEGFLAHLRRLDESEMQALSEAADRASNEVVVRSAFPLTPTYEDQVRQALHQLLNRPVSADFETDRSRIGGIEVCFADQKVGWSMDSYLDTLERQTAELIVDETSHPERPGPAS